MMATGLEPSKGSPSWTRRRAPATPTGTVLTSALVGKTEVGCGKLR